MFVFQKKELVLESFFHNLIKYWWILMGGPSVFACSYCMDVLRSWTRSEDWLLSLGNFVSTVPVSTSSPRMCYVSVICLNPFGLIPFSLLNSNASWAATLMYISSTLSEDKSNSGKYSWHFSFHILSAFTQVKFAFQSKFEVSWKATSLACVNSI